SFMCRAARKFARCVKAGLRPAIALGDFQLQRPPRGPVVRHIPREQPPALARRHAVRVVIPDLAVARAPTDEIIVRGIRGYRRRKNHCCSAKRKGPTGHKRSYVSTPTTPWRITI